MGAGDEDSIWHEELAVEAAYAFLSQAVSISAREEIDLPHIVVCRDTETGAVSYSGPFPDGLSALVAADRDGARDALNSGTPMRFSVAALLPDADQLPVPSAADD